MNFINVCAECVCEEIRVQTAQLSEVIGDQAVAVVFKMSLWSAVRMTKPWNQGISFHTRHDDFCRSGPELACLPLHVWLQTDNRDGCSCEAVMGL